MEALSVSIVGLLQLLGYSYFMTQPEDQCSPAPCLGSWLFLLATLCFLWDLSIYPRRFMHMAWQCQLIVEIVAGLFLAEIAMLRIWCGLERIIYWLTEQLIHELRMDDCRHELHQYCLHGLTTVAVSGAIVWFVIRATDVPYYLDCSMRKIKRNGQHMIRILGCIGRMNSCERRRTLRACRRAIFSRYGETTSSEGEEDGDGDGVEYGNGIADEEDGDEIGDEYELDDEVGEEDELDDEDGIEYDDEHSEGNGDEDE
ncbi:PREDICTED: uncharacterized protein LOC108609861 [Drosophila arizonae]|uniref:Uncharacterized protein LOC108609861 n=1 Tax=Drosophila arizonae TaxID=7263 RepID=A0ABM1NQ87_DROAR|nr:PREDICTED: uncharacterized protein LOC108609861 [Drosophila arizonae]